MKLKRTHKLLTEQDAIELAEAAGYSQDIYKVEHYPGQLNRYVIYYKGGSMGYISEAITEGDSPINEIECCFDSEDEETKGLFINTLSFTNKALELGYYEIVE